MSDFDPRFDPAYQPGFDPSKHTPAPVRPPTGETADVVAPPTDEPTPPPMVAAPAVPTRVRRNPILITLWVLSALFVASGFYGLRLIGDRVAALGLNDGFGGADYYLLQSYVVLAPLLIVLGLATVVGTLFVLAVRRAR